jgi:ribosomal protein L40E
MQWACARCDTLHTQNAASCRSCGHEILRPVDERELEARSEGTAAPAPMDIDDDRVLGTSPEPEYATSPDVAVDGSVARTPDNEQDESPTGWWTRLRALLPF